MRYIARLIRNNGTPVIGSSNTLVRDYASDRNALHFMHRHLAAPHFEPGQYLVETWPRSAPYDESKCRKVGYLYKTVPSPITSGHSA